ncbi:MAG: hypothetical protein ACOZCE_01980 [Spirochaetota bacterium]
MGRLLLISLSGDPKKIAALNALPALIEKMTLVKTESDRGKNPNVIEVKKQRLSLKLKKKIMYLLLF